jgi:hypothetical protein
MPPRAHGDDYDDYATMPPRAGGDDYDDYATMSMRQRTADDIVNATLLLVDMEIERYKKQQTSAWSNNSFF